MKVANKKKITVGLIFLLAFVAVGCSKGTDGKETSKKDSTTNTIKEPYSDTQFLMGTVVKVSIYNEGKEAVLEKAFDRIKELAAKITVNEKGSEIDAINDNAGVKPVEVTDDMYYLLKEAQHYSKTSEGGFDMAIGAVTDLWRIGFPDARKPSQAEIDAVLPLVDYHKVIFDDEKQTVYLSEKGMQLDLGAIAKGYITDEVAIVLKDNDVDTAIIDLGGNIFVMGTSPRREGADWNVGIQDPNQTRGTTIGSIPESNRSIVTSGIYERFYEDPDTGIKYDHLMNGKTGYPFDNDIAGVTIVSDKSIAGDGLSTAVFSKGVKGGLEFIDDIDGVEAIFVTKENEVYISKGLKDTFKLTSKDYTLEKNETLK
ncbi:FAD:protein FMN transferase [Carnobacterium maltaromaticum]|uniref:FAD:protein FMN transferase n=1 Tax=Carnobacterium maltaromaticum TaxID=2751 RepID=UPI0039B0E04B